MIHFRHSIGFRLLVISFILLALPLLVDSFILVQKRYQHAISDAKGLLLEVAHLKEIPISEVQSLDRPIIEVLSNYLGLDAHFPQEPSEQLNEKLDTLSKVGGFYGIFLLKISPDNHYTIVASGRSEYIGRDFTGFFQLTDLYTPKSLERGYASYLSLDNRNLHPYFVIAHPIYSLKESRYVGVIALADDVSSKLNVLLQADKRNDYTINFALLWPTTIVFAASDPTLQFHYFLPLKKEFKELFLKESPLVAKHLASAPLSVNTQVGYPFFEFTWKNQQQIGYIKPITNASYELLTYASKRDIFHTPLLNFFSLYSIYGIILIVGGSAATLLTMQMARPIQLLGFVMQKIQSGDLNVRYQRDPFGFEINTLGDIFNEMVRAVLTQKSVAQEERVKRESLERELRLGRQVQHNLLPQKMPLYPGVEVAETYIPAIEVGGDFYDIFIKEDNGSRKLVLAIADVSGKGVQACFFSLGVRNMLRTYASKYSDIAEVMFATDQLFQLDTGDSGMFVTVLSGIYDYRTKKLDYFSCGHNPGLIKRANGQIDRLESTGVAMGIYPTKQGVAHTVQLEKGDTLVFYTDGVTESHNEKYEFFGEKRLIECLIHEPSSSAVDVVTNIVSAINKFVATAAQHDDITLLVMRIKDD